MTPKIATVRGIRLNLLIKSRAIQYTPIPPNVNHNPLPNQKNQGVNTITLEEDYDLKGTIVTIGSTEATKKAPWAALLITV